MPILGALLGGLFSELFHWLYAFLGRKVALATALIGAVGVFYLALFAAFTGLMSSLIAAVPSEGGAPFYLGVWLALPYSFTATTSAVVTWEAGLVAFRWNLKNLDLIAKA